MATVRDYVRKPRPRPLGLPTRATTPPYRPRSSSAPSTVIPPFPWRRESGPRLCSCLLRNQSQGP